MDIEEIDLIGGAHAPSPRGANGAEDTEAEEAMMRRAKKVSARIHQKGRSEAAAQNVGWLKELRAETNADIAFMVTLIKGQSM